MNVLKVIKKNFRTRSTDCNMGFVFFYRFQIIICIQSLFCIMYPQHANISPHENKKALSPFYHEKYFWQKMNLRHPIDVLYSFSIKNIFDNKMDLRLFYFEVYRACFRPFLVQCNSPTVKKFFRFFVYFFSQFLPLFFS